MIPEEELTAEVFGTKIKFYMENPRELTNMAAKARKYGKPEAAQNIVDDCYRLFTG